MRGIKEMQSSFFLRKTYVLIKRTTLAEERRILFRGGDGGGGRQTGPYSDNWRPEKRALQK